MSSYPISVQGVLFNILKRKEDFMDFTIFPMHISQKFFSVEFFYCKTSLLETSVCTHGCVTCTSHKITNKKKIVTRSYFDILPQKFTPQIYNSLLKVVKKIKIITRMGCHS